ncbi:hypothetical protein [Mycolicibacterium llatzerense]|uniref:hypothetical protein n=1 Tax=Mycolicibacterium llatzerense TaxID=280871 RepID=UPI0021B4EE2B|nr:hypothetical protein [Mycolicibacterium llatzerense]MCT7364223.1 hypothetical protein [Mycolicibacterium llatzerense]
MQRSGCNGREFLDVVALGGIPVVRFDNLDGLGEYEPHLDLLDRINDTTLQRIIGFWYQALRQRAMFGNEDEGDEDEPDSAPVDWNTMLNAGPGALWRFPSDFKLQELQQADFWPVIHPNPEDWFQRLSAMFMSPTRPQWQDRLMRPSVIRNSEGAGPAHISRYWTPRNQYLDTLWSYKVGDPPLPQIQPEYADAFRDVLRKARSNYAPMCIGAMLDRLELQAVSTLADSDADGDDLAADIMDETGFGAVLKNLFGFALSMGEGYGMVVPGVKGGATLSSGALSPSIHAIDPRRCIGIPDLSNPVRLRAALVRQYDSITGEYSSHFFLPGEKWTLNWDDGLQKWSDAVYEPVEGLDALGVDERPKVGLLHLLQLKGGGWM